MKYYLAYGSNLSTQQMAFRCPDARVVGIAAIQDWRIVFKTHADIVPAKGYTVPVLVWEISDDDEKSLDRYEGFPRYYVKKDFKVTMTNLNGKGPREINAMAYVMTDLRDHLREPSDHYYWIILNGYRRFGFDQLGLETALTEAQMATLDYTHELW